MKMEQSVPKHRHIKFRGRGFTQKKAYNLSLQFSNNPRRIFLGSLTTEDGGTTFLRNVGITQQQCHIPEDLNLAVLFLLSEPTAMFVSDLDFLVV